MDCIDEHIIEAIGKTRVVIRNGRVVSVGSPLIRECPLARRFAVPVDPISADAIRANIEERIRSFGMCTKDRDVLCDRDFVLFGASELLGSGIKSGLIDSVVLVCDGAGTLVTDKPTMVQGVGGRMSGLVKTSPIQEVIGRIEENGGRVVFPDTAVIDQVGGVDAAHNMGYNHVAVTVATPDDAEIIRETYPETVIVGVHVTGLGKDESARLVDLCDLVYSCASGHIRSYAGRSALVQGGTAIPVFAMTKAGKEIIVSKIKKTGSQILIKGETLPFSGPNMPSPLI
ncbi:MAG: DUF2099 family protein [Methanogenium sp.]|nr:DUF2099 family protein [Methanogenium sp.]